MSIVKSKHASNYTVLPNEIFKSGLSVEAIGLLCYFLSLPHDWVIYKTQLHSQLNMGREKLDRVFKELQNKGFVLSVKKHSETGKIEYEHIVYDKPYNGEPSLDIPYTEKPSTANTQLQSKEELNTKEQSKKDKIKNIPPLFEFLDFATTNKPNVDLKAVELKYKSWVENNWNDGNGKKIINWKSKLLNTLPYIAIVNGSSKSKMVF